ncbi:hypothetical protein [Nonomuraea dietziae]|uniref:hypothetical protein n=1 Tax=Nonomuraea dietziae TaxID=65515 RepID=UPI00340D5214
MEEIALCAGVALVVAGLRASKGWPPLVAAAYAVDAGYRARLRWWDGIDLNTGNVRQALDGRVAVIDVFCMDGASLYPQVLKGASVVREKLPGSRHLLDIPYIAMESTPEQIRALHDFWCRTP